VREGGGGGVPLEGTWPSNYIKLTTCSTEYRIQSTENPIREYNCNLTHVNKNLNDWN
jgi:hypothetical protein